MDSELFEKMLEKMEYVKCPVNEIRCRFKYMSKSCVYEDCEVKKFLKDNNITVSWDEPYENQLMKQTAKEFSIYERSWLVRVLCHFLLSIPSSLKTKTKIANMFLPKSSKRDMNKEKDVGW